MKTQKTLKRDTLADQVAEQLIADIQNSMMLPGDQLPSEGELALNFNISRPVVREALGQLKSLGLIEMHSGRRPIVQSIDGKLPGLFFNLSLAFETSSVLELLEVRQGLEVQSAILAAQRANNDDRVRLEKIVTSMEKHLTVDESKAFIDLDVQLHLQIAAASRNVMLRNLISSIRGPMRKTIERGLEARNTSEDLERIHILHLAIVDAICRGDSDAASAAMSAHFDDALVAIVSGQNIKVSASSK